MLLKLFETLDAKKTAVRTGNTSQDIVFIDFYSTEKHLRKLLTTSHEHWVQEKQNGYRKPPTPVKQKLAHPWQKALNIPKEMKCTDTAHSLRWKLSFKYRGLFAAQNIQTESKNRFRCTTGHALRPVYLVIRGKYNARVRGATDSD